MTKGAPNLVGPSSLIFFHNCFSPRNCFFFVSAQQQLKNLQRVQISAMEQEFNSKLSTPPHQSHTPTAPSSLTAGQYSSKSSSNLPRPPSSTKGCWGTTKTSQGLRMSTAGYWQQGLSAVLSKAKQSLRSQGHPGAAAGNRGKPTRWL